jgi:von Willebrand factor type A domain
VQTVRWQRGQPDALQVRLDAPAPARARLDLVFVIDATGSMGDEIDKLKRSMREVADRIAAWPGLVQAPDLCFGLVAYRDRGDAFFVRGADLTNDLAAFQAELGALHAGGGGDYPEAMAEALHTAVHRLSWRGEGTARLVVLLADAPPQRRPEGPHLDHEARAALARGIKIVSVGASGLDREGELAMRLAAQATGGRFVFLTYANRHDPASGPGRETVHEVQNYSVETLDKLIVRLVGEELAAWPAP